MIMTGEPATIPEVTHHTVAVDGASIHYVTAGRDGTPILLVHGFPETWWTFHKIVPLLAEHHRVIAVDLRGFGDSSTVRHVHDSATAADDLRQVIEHLDVGPVHLTGQDISGATVFRLAAEHSHHVRSVTAIEMELAGFGLEMLGDVTHGGSWHIGVLAAAEAVETLLVGRERRFLGGWAFPAMTAAKTAVAEADIDEFVRTYSRPGGWGGATALYRSMLVEGDELAALAEARPLAVPVLAVGAGGGTFTVDTLRQVTSGAVESVQLDEVGHYVALEAPVALADAIVDFTRRVDERSRPRSATASGAR